MKNCLHLLNYRLFYLLMFILITFASKANEYYWVGGSGSWSDFSNHWATTSGGSSFHAQVPSANDNVHFDANSFTAAGQVVNADNTVVFFKDMDWTGALYNPQFAQLSTSSSMSIFGSLTLISNMNWNVSGSVAFLSNTTGKTITSAGKVFKHSVNFSGSGGGWILQDDFTMDGSAGANNSGLLTLEFGTLNTNSKTVTCSGFQSNNSNVRSFNITNSTIKINHNYYYINPWEINQNTNFTFTSTGSTIEIGGTYQYNNYLYSVNLTYNKVKFTNPDVIQSYINGSNNIFNGDVSFSGICVGTGQNTFNGSVLFQKTATIGGSSTFNGAITLLDDGTFQSSNTFNGALNLTAGKTYLLNSGYTQTLGALGSLNATGSCTSPIYIKSTQAGSQAIISKTGGSLNVDQVVMQDIKAIVTSPNTANATNSFDGGNNTNWVFPAFAGTAMYWIGGSGNWNDPNHWSASSGGPAGSCIPGPGNDVFFDNHSFSSNGQTVMINVSTASCKSMNWTGAGFTPSFNSSSTANTLRIFGSVTLIAAMNLNYDGNVSFESSNTGNTIISATKAWPTYYNNSIYFNGTGSWILQDAFSTPSGIINLSAGTLNTNNQAVNCYYFNSQTSNNRTLILGSTEWTCLYYWQLTNGANFTLDAGTSTIKLFYGYSFYGGGKTYNNVSFENNNNGSTAGLYSTGTFNGTVTIQGDAYFGDNFTFNGNLILTPGHTYTFYPYATQTIGATGTLNANGSCTNYITLKSNNNGLQATINKLNGNLSVNNCLIQDIKATLTSPYLATAINKSVDLGGNTNWNFSGNSSATLYWVGGSGNWNDPAHWSLSSGGAGGTCAPGPQDDVYFDQNSFTANGQTVMINISNPSCRNMNWTGAKFTPNVTYNTYGKLTIYGSLTLIPAMNFNYNAPVYFESRTTGNTITTAGKYINNLYFNSVSGSWDLLDAFNGYDIELIAGTFNTNNNSITTYFFYSSSNSVRTLNLGSSLVSIGYYWNVYNSNFTFNSGTSTIKYTNPNSNYPFYGGDLTYYNLTFEPSSSTAVMYGNNTFNGAVNFKSPGQIAHNNVFKNNVTFIDNGIINNSNTYNGILKFTSGKSYTLGANIVQNIATTGTLNAVGTPCAPIAISSSINGTYASISKASGEVCADYLYLTSVKGTGGATFSAGLHSTISPASGSGWQNTNCSGSLQSSLITSSGALCGSNGITLSSRQATSYLWSTGATTQSINVNSPGTYTLSIVNLNGCSESGSLTVAGSTPPSCSITGSQNAAVGSNETYTAPPGAASYAWSVSGKGVIQGSAIGQSVIVKPTGCEGYELTLLVTNSDGCSSTCNVSVSVTDNIAPTINCPANISIASGSGLCGNYVNFNVTGSDNSGLYTITTVPASGSFFSTGTTTVTATIKDACGNTNTCTFNVTVTGITATAIVSNNSSGAVQAKNMTFGSGGDVQFSVSGPGTRVSGGRTTAYSGINTTGYGGLWWTFNPIENPRHSSQSSSTGNMVFDHYDATTGIMYFASTANMTWATASGTENIATRMRVQLQPYGTGTHTGPLISGWINPVTAGSISLNIGTPNNSNYPLIDVKALGSTAQYRVWYIIETASGVPLQEYYDNSHALNNTGSNLITSFTGQYYSSALSTCQGGTVTVTVSATGGSGNYTGTGAFQVQPGNTYSYTVTDGAGCSSTASVTIPAVTPIQVTAVASNINSGTPALQNMIFSGPGQNVTFAGQGPGNKVTGGRTNIYSNLNTGIYSGFWWTFAPIDNPRHSSQNATGQMAFNSYNPTTGIITFTSTANMIWQTANGTVSIATRLRMQLQPYTGTHSGPIGSGWIVPVTAGGISLSSLSSGYPLLDIKATGNPGKYQVWYIIETSSGVPLQEYYNSSNALNNTGNDLITSVTGSFYATQSSCQGGPVNVTVSATGGSGTYSSGVGTFAVSAGQHTFTVTDNNGCTGSATLDAQPQNCIQLSCTADKEVNTDAGKCTAVVSGIDPEISPDGSAVTYSLSGMTEGNGNGSASGLTFNKGETTVTYASVTDPTKTCSFKVTVIDKEAPAITQPQDIDAPNTTDQCQASVSFSATATDNCGVVSKKYFLNYGTNAQTEITSSTTFAVGLTNVITVEAKDAAGNVSTKTFTIKVSDKQPPSLTKGTISGCYSDVATAQAAAIAATSKSDNCPGTLQVSASTSGSCAAVVTVTVMDAAGNSNSVAYNTKIDNTAPVLSAVPASTTVNCHQVPDAQTITANDNCDGAVGVTFAESSTKGTDPAMNNYYNYKITRKWSATDDCGNLVSHTQIITVQDVTPPMITCPDNISVTNVAGTCSRQVNFAAQASDLCSPVSVKYYLHYGEEDQAEITSPKTFNVGVYTVKAVATDISGNASDCSFTITVTDNQNPVITPLAKSNTKMVNNDFQITVNIQQDCKIGVPTDLLTYFNISDNCGIKSSVFSLTPGSPLNNQTNNSSNAITLTVTDVNDNVTTFDFHLIAKDVTPPVFTAPADRDVNLGTDCKIIVPDLIAGLAGTTTGCSASSFSQLPAAGTALSLNHNQTVTVVITANSAGGTTAKNVVLTAKDVTKPVLTAGSDRNVTMNTGDNSCSINVPDVRGTAVDCNLASIVQSPTVGAVVGAAHNIPIRITVTATDAAGLTDVKFVYLTPKDETAPVVTPEPSKDVSMNTGNNTCSVTIPDMRGTATDNCTGTTITQIPAIGTVVSTSHGSTINVVVTATDAAGLTNIKTVVITAKDVTNPVLTPAVDQNVTMNSSSTVNTCSITVPDVRGTATDNCTVTITQSPIAGAISPVEHNGVVSVTVTATDAGGNTDVKTVKLTAKDVTAPVITVPADVTVATTDAGDCSASNVTIGLATATDNCKVSVAGSRSDGKPLTYPYPFGQTTITWTATDAAGLTDVKTQKVIVQKVQAKTSVTVSPTSQQYSDKVTFKATVTPYTCPVAGDINNNNAGKVVFKIGTFKIGEAPIVNGVATLADQPLLEDKAYYTANINPSYLNGTAGPLQPGNKTVTAEFVSIDADFLASNATTPLTINCEDADITYTGGTYFTVNPSTLKGTVFLSANVSDRNDAPTQARGNIRNASVTFRNGGMNGTIVGETSTNSGQVPIPVGLINPSDTTNGVANTSFTDQLNNSDVSSGGKVYQMWVGTSNYYCGNMAGDLIPVTLGMPGQDFVTGGGYITLGSNVSGTYGVGAAGQRMNGGLVMKWNSSGKNLQGQVNIIFRRMEGGVKKIYQIKSNAINTLVVENVNDAGTVVATNNTFRRATINTKCNLTDITNPLAPVSLGGNLDLLVTAWESTTVNTGALDRISVQVTGAGSIGVLFSSNWSGGKTVYQQLNGGKMQVRSTSTSAAITQANNALQAEVRMMPDASLKAYPNPSNTYFNIVLGSTDEQSTITVHITDLSGRVIETKSGLKAGQTITIGNSYRPGMYVLEMIQGDLRKQVKLIKLIL